jgi:glycogen synthase
VPEICLTSKVWRSGSAWVAQMLALAIAERGVQIAFVSPLADPIDREPLHPNLLRITPPRELIGHSNRPARVRASLKRISSSLWSVIKLSATTKNFIFSIPEPLIFTLPLFALLRAMGKRIVLIVHDAEPHAWSLPERFRRIERGAHALSYRLSSMLVTLTPSARDALIGSFNINRARVHVIPHGPFSLTRNSPVPGSGRMLIFGSLRRNKSVLEVINGVKRVRRDGAAIVLVLAGEPLKQEPGYWEECLSAISEDPAGFDVRVGFLPDEELPSLIETVDGFMLAYENFDSQSGVGVLAALAGRPVIGTKSGGLNELFERGLSGVTINGKVSDVSVAEAIKVFLDVDYPEWNSRARAGARAVAENLQWDIIADEYIALFRRQ